MTKPAGGMKEEVIVPDDSAGGEKIIKVNLK